ncbi:MAG: 4Fe-4S cluster-binding domain-containing protein [Deltaproteobacteria bacterium]|nr:4Fe-4S cluster-binding domain-containing protein [Deltaproteobacteria bacterium]
MSTANKVRIERLEFNVTHGCILKCENCDHLSPFFPVADDMNGKAVNLQQYKTVVETLAKHIVLDEMVMLGGEPLLSKQLPEYLRLAKETGLAKKLTLITNGFLLPKMDPKVLDYVDAITVSVYPSMPLDRSKTKETEELCKTRGVPIEFFTQRHFQYSVLSKRINNKKLVGEIFETCSLAWTQKCHTIFEDTITRCSRVPFLDIKLREAGAISKSLLEMDALKIVDRPGLGDEIAAYLDSHTVMETCHYCLGTVGKPNKHTQLTPQQIKDNVWTQLEVDHAINWVKLKRRFWTKKLLGRF